MTGQLQSSGHQAAQAGATSTAHSLQSLANEATAALRDENWARAENLFVRLCRLAPRSAQAHYNLGLLLKRRGAVDKAEFILSRTIKLDPNHMPALFELGLVLSEERKHDAALRVFGKLASLNPENREVRLYLGMLLVEKGEAQRALTHLKRAGDGLEQSYYRAKALIELGRLHDAIGPLRELPRSTALRLLSAQRRGVLFMDERIYEEILED